VKQDAAEAVRWLHIAANNGNVFAMYWNWCGIPERRGVVGSSKDCHAARQWMEKAAAAAYVASAGQFSHEPTLKRHEEIMQSLRSRFEGQFQW
jgi:TPR repeat protein